MYLIFLIVLQSNNQEWFEGFHVLQEVTAQNCTGTHTNKISGVLTAQTEQHH